MRTLVIAPEPFFAYRGTPFSVYYRTLVSAEIGLQCDLLTYGQGIDVPLPGCRIYRIPSLRWLGNVRVGPSLFKAFLDSLMVLWTIALLCRRRYTVVHAHEEAVFWCMWLKPLFRFRLIYDMHSSLPQQLVNFDFTRVPFLRRLFARWERQAVETSEGVITVCPALHDHAKALTSEHGKIFLIENSIVEPPGGRFSSAHGATAATADAARQWLEGQRAEQTLIYAGTLEAYQGIDLLLDAFSRVARVLPGASLLILGGQPRQVEKFQHRADELGISSRTYFAGLLSHVDAMGLVKLCAVAVSPRTSGSNTPMKIYELIASGVPLVATRIESHTQVLSDDICTLTDIEPQAMAEGIVSALTNPERIREKAQRAVAWYRAQYSRESYTGKLRALIDRVAA